MRPPHSDPSVERVFQRLVTYCRWQVRFSDSQYFCECKRHKFSFRIATLSKTVLSADEIKTELSELFPCVGDWSP